MNPEPDVMRFYARAAQDWLDLEVPGVSVGFVAPDRLRLGAEFELRLRRGDCRWQLRRRRGSTWRAVVPAKPCTSLTDWLAQLRRVHNLMYKAGTAGRETELETQV